jgi:hypothetical protein
MMLGDDYDARISDWLREGPEEARRRPVAAALAHAQAHPRRRMSERPVPSGPDAATWPGALRGLLRRRPLFAVGGLAAAAVIVLVVSFGLLAPVRLPSGPALPVAAPSASAAAADAADLGALTGTWTGTVSKNAQECTSRGCFLSGTSDTRWAATLTFGECGIGLVCGSMDLQPIDDSGTRLRGDCRIELTLSSPDRAGPWSTFTEDPVDATDVCDLGSLDVKVGAGGAAGSADSLMVQDWKNGNLLRQGLLTRSPAP